MAEREIEFEWDEAKARTNLEKHGVSFLTAAAIFLNEMLERIAQYPCVHDYGEVRWIALGRVQTEVYRVVYTWRGKSLVRIVSAKRRAVMKKKSTIVRHSLSEIETMRERGLDKTRADAPPAESLARTSGETAGVVLPPWKPPSTCFASTATWSSGFGPGAGASTGSERRAPRLRGSAKLALIDSRNCARRRGVLAPR